MDTRTETSLSVNTRPALVLETPRTIQRKLDFHEECDIGSRIETVPTDGIHGDTVDVMVVLHPSWWERFLIFLGWAVTVRTRTPVKRAFDVIDRSMTFVEVRRSR